MFNPFFKYFKQYRNTFEQLLFNGKIARVKTYPGTAHISLPAPIRPTTGLADLIEARISESDHAGTDLPLIDLSTILYWSAGILGERRDGQDPNKSKLYRPHPSGGAKYPLELYICADRIPELEPGMYHYRPDTHELEFLRSMDQDEIARFKQGYGYPFVQDMPALVVMSFVLERGMPKYGALAYKIGLIEAGHVAQNLYLNAAALGVRCSALGGLDEVYTHELLNIDGYNECTFYSVGLGKPTQQVPKSDFV